MQQQPAAVPEFDVLSTSPPPPPPQDDIEEGQSRGGGMRKTPSSRMSVTIAARRQGESNRTASAGTSLGAGGEGGTNSSDNVQQQVHDNSSSRRMSMIVPPPLATHPGKTAALVVASLGVVFGDIGTSPLYTLNTVIGVLLADPVNETSPLSDIVVAVYCLLFYSLFWVVSVKYVFWVMRVNHDGNGGALAMARVILNSLNDDETMTKNDTAVDVKDNNNYNNNNINNEAPAQVTNQTTTTITSDASFIRKNKIIMIVAILSASFLIGDGVITPPNTVLGALTSPVITISKELNVLVSVIILLITFAVQRFGSMAIGKTFGPIMILWFATLAILGLISIVQHPNEARVLLRAFNPACLSILGFKNVFYSLSGVILAVTGGEALYADLGHFGYKAIAIAWWSVAFPALAIQYYGQCCLVLSLESMNTDTRELSGGGGSVHPSVPANLVYALVPTNSMSETAGQICVWLLTILAILASVIASQALISGLFTILQQAYALDLVPRLNIMHTNPHEKGQVFISEINTLMCITCVLLVVIFQTSENLISSYGIAVAFCMFLTDVSMGFVMGWVYKCHWVVTILICLPFLFVDGMFLSSNLIKLTEDPYAFTSIVISLVVFFFMQSHWWTKTTLKKVVGRGMNESRMPGDLGATTIQSQTSEGLPTDIDNILHLLSESKLLKRMPVAGIFLTPFKQTAPVALSILARSLTALPETIILWHVSFLADKPFVNDHERYDLTCHSEELGVYSLNMYFGYCEPITADDFDVNNSLSEIFSSEGYPALQKLVDEDRMSKSSRILFAPFQNQVEEQTTNWTYFLPVRKYVPDQEENVLHKIYVYTCDFLTRNSKPSREFFGLSSLDTIEMSIVTRINSKDKME